MRETRSSAKKQKLVHDPSDIEDKPSRRAQKRETAKVRSADREAKSAGKCPWGSRGQITTNRGTPTDQTQEHAQRSPDSELQITQRNNELGSSMDQARIRQLESELFESHAKAEVLSAHVRQLEADLSTADLCTAELAEQLKQITTRISTVEKNAAAAEARATAMEAREAEWQKQVDWSKWQKTVSGSQPPAV